MKAGDGNSLSFLGLRSREPQESRADRSLRRGPGLSRSLQNTSPVRGRTIDLVNLIQILFSNFMFSSQLSVTSSHTSVCTLLRSS